MKLLKPIPRKEGVQARTVWVGLFGRFADELLSGLFVVLLPTFRSVFNLSLAQASLLLQILEYVAVIVEPVAGVLNDIWQRKWIMAFGAAVCGLSLMTMGIAPTFLVLLLGFALYGLGTGPMAHSADILLVETHPDAPERIFARSTLLDTIGALIAPLLVPIGAFIGLEWRWLLILAGASGVIYALVIGRTPFPAINTNDEAEEDAGLLQTVRANLQTVLRDPQSRRWLIFLLILHVFEIPFQLKTIWLNEAVGMSQRMIGFYIAFEMAIGVLALLLLDRLRESVTVQRLLQAALVVMLLTFPAWLLLPGIWTRFLLAVPLNLAFALLWPISRAQSLAAIPGKAGAVTAIHSLFSILPLTLLFGLFAQSVSLTTAMLVVQLPTILVMLWAMVQPD